MIISIHQPDYIPYPGYFYKIAQSDVFVFLDDAQYSNDNMHQWNRIKTPQGECRLKIPVKHEFGDNINEVQTRDNLKWREKHLKTIEMNYLRAPYFPEAFPAIREIIASDHADLAELNIELNTHICRCFGIGKKFIRSSDMDISTRKEERVIDICVMLGGTKYISGNGARAYQTEEHFTSRGVELCYTDYHPFEYEQLWGDFIPNLSILDYIFNCGYDWDRVERSIREVNGMTNV